MKRYGASLLLLVLLHIISFSTLARDFYWIGGSGNFNDIQHWSDQPGGKVNSGALLPDKDDNVYFDQYSFPDPGATVTITNVARCANMHWGDVKNMPTLTTDSNEAHYLVIYGGVTFNNNMILNLNRPLYFRASTIGNEIDFGGNVFDGDLVFENNGGWRITSEVDIIDNDIYFNQGTLSIEADVNCGRFISENSVSRELFLNSSNINLNKSGSSVISIQTENLNITPGDSKISILSNNSSIETSGTKSIEFNDVVFEGNSGIVSTSALQASFNELTFRQNGRLQGQNDFQELEFTQGFTYEIDSDGVQNVQDVFIAKGECYAYITINGANSGGFISAENVDLNYLKVKNISASGAAVNFNATNSYDLGGNTAWIFGDPSFADYTWTGATDNNWGTPSNWSDNCVPSRNNNAIIPAGSTVEIDVPAECKSLDIDDNATLGGSGVLDIYGSLTATNSTWAYDGETCFKGTAVGNTISINATMAGSMVVDGTGEWSLLTELNIDNILNINSGTFKANGNVISIDQFNSNSMLPRTFDITNTNVKINEGVTKAWSAEGSNFILVQTGSVITLTQSGAEFYNNLPDGVIYGKVVFNPLDNLVFLTNGDDTSYPEFEELKFNGSANIVGNHQYSNLILSKGNEYTFEEGSVQKILVGDGFSAHGTCSENITLKGNGGVAYLQCDVNSTDIVRIRVENVNVTGGFAGVLEARESIGVTGYDGWVFPDDLMGGDVYWTGDVNDDWFEAGNWDIGCIPTRKDNVLFEDAKVTGSSVVKISIKGKIAECNDMTWKDATGMTFNGDQPLNVFGSFDLTGMTDGQNNFSGEISFKSEESEIIKTGIIQLSSDLKFEGNEQEDGSWNSGTWTLDADLITIGSIVLENGNLVTANNNIETKEFLSNFGVDNVRSLDLGSSTVSLERMEVSAEAFTLNSGTSLIEFNVAGEFVISQGDEILNFYNVTYDESDGNAYLDVFANDVSFNEMVFNGNTYFRKTNTTKIGFTAESIRTAVGKTYVFESGQTYVLGNVIANGACEGTIDITGSDSDAAIFKAKTGVADIEVNSVNLLNINADPVDVFVAKSSLDLGNTTGWKFEDEPVGDDLYWIGGTGNWDDPDHWATFPTATVADGCVPTAKDNVYFTEYSFTDFDQIVYTGAGDIRCRTMDWTGSETARPNFEMGATDISGVYIYGSLILNSQVDIDLSPMVDFYFRATEAQNINTFGYVFPNNVEFDGKDGVWNMLADFQTEGDLFIRHGKLVANGNLLECKSLTSTDTPEGINSRGLDIANSNVIINGSEDGSGRSVYINLADEFYDQGFELIADNSTVKLADNAELVLVGTGAHSISFNELIFENDGELESGFSGLDVYVSHLLFKGNGNINGKNNRFGTLELSRGFEFKFEKGRTITTDNLLVEGSCFAPIYLHSSKEGVGNETFIVSKNNVVGNFLELKDIHADVSSGVSYTATNSFKLGNVVGWNTDETIAPIALYWTGNGVDDSWHNHENWSRAADGSEEGCIPTLNDDVFFTENSFLGSKLVEITADARCHNMTWEDDIDPDANFSINSKLQIGGFMDLAESMTLDMQGVFEFIGDGILGDKIVDFAEKSMDGDIRFQGNGQSWIWKSGLITSGDLFIEAGYVSTQGHNFTVSKFSSLSLDDFDAVRKFDMSNSLVTVSSDEITGWNMIMNTTGGLEFISSDSKITFTNGGGIYCRTDGDVSFGFVDFFNNGVINITSSSDLEHGHFNSVRFLEQGKIFGKNSFSNLEFTLGYENNTIESGKLITIEYDLKMEGVRCSYVFLKASTPGSPAFINKPSGIFEKIYNASLTDIQGTSGSGLNHLVKYKYDNTRSTGFEEYVDPSGEENPPSFEDSFDLPKEEWCSNVAVLDHVKGFPINNSTTFQWYYSIDGAADPYEEMDGETNAVIEVTENGFYKVEVIYGLTNEATPCIIESIIEVSLGEVSTVSLEITANNVKCFGENNGHVVAKVKSVQYPEYQFFWKNEDGVEPTNTTNKTEWENTAINLAPGKYYVTVADGKNCEFDTIVNIFDAYELLIDDIDTKDLTCFTVPEGEIKISASGGTGNLSYYLDGEIQADENFTDLFSGDYKIFVQDENNCKTDEVDITLNSNPEIELSLNGMDLRCYGESNGEFSPTITGGVPDYSYSWSGPDGFSSTDLNISGLSGGTYKLTVTDDSGCIAEDENDLSEPQELIAEELVIEPTTCHGEATGELFVVGGQGTPNYRYLLDGVEDATGIFKGLAPENYELRIIDAHGCIYDQDIEITEPSEIRFQVADKVLPSCEKTEDGIIHITPFGGNEGYTFSWTGPNDYKSYDQNIENLISGEYHLEITDKKNCSSSDVVDLDLGLTLQLGLVVEQHVKTAGTNTGILALEILEGTIPYTFTISGPGISIDSPDNFDDHYYLEGDLPAGVYTVIASDASGCATVEKSIIIEEPEGLFAYVEQVKSTGCTGGSDGELTVVVAGGTGTYAYSWTGPGGFSASTKDITGLVAGVYSVTVSDGGNIANANFEMLPADPIVANVASFNNVTCYQSADGMIELAIETGGVDYTIEWTSDNGFLSSAKRILDLEPGIYDYKVTTVGGCFVEGNQIITEPDPLSISVEAFDISIEGERDGSVTANFGNGTAPYTVLVSGPNGYSFSEIGNTSGTLTVTGLEMGIYEVAVIDDNGCRIEDSKKVHEPTKLLLYTTSVVDVVCPGENTGSITIGVEGASDPANLTFTWKGDNYFRSNDQDISNLKAGQYELTLYDSGGEPGYEEQRLIVHIVEPDILKIEYNLVNISCPGMNDGYINIQPQGGTPGYSCVWTGTGVLPNDEDQKNLAPGIYTVVVTDNNGCISEPKDIEVIEPPALVVSVEDFKEPTCYGYENGWIHLKIENGTAPYLVEWDNYGSITQNIEELENGLYNFTVTDDNGCSVTDNITLNEPDTLIAEINDYTDVLCHGDGTGRAYVDISGGTPDYTIIWSDSQDTQEATDLKLGTYEVSVTDTQGCTDVSSIEIFEPEPLAMEVEVIRPTTYESMDGGLNIDVTGGVPNYMLDWVDQDLNSYTGADINDLERGTYQLTITDQNNCQIDSTIVLEYLFERRVRIPKAFTPNADGYNDYWDIERIEFIQDLKIVIYDRWGKAVYKFSGTGNDYRGEPWKGADGTKKLPIGSYYYAVELDDEKPIMGTVTILR